MQSQPVWQDVAHAIFNLKEFILCPVTIRRAGDIRPIGFARAARRRR